MVSGKDSRASRQLGFAVYTVQVCRLSGGCSNRTKLSVLHQ